jgi:dipeptidyl aminopeptidase/acylaminoacyl peptidase
MRDLRVLTLGLLAACATSGSPPKPESPAAAKTEAAAPADGGRVAPTERTPAQLDRDRALEARAAVVVDAFQNRIAGFGGVLTHDRKRVVFGSNRDGSPQLYIAEVGRPAAAPKQLTKDERVQSASLSRDGKWILFTRDRGADENAHIYRIGLDGNGLVDLTPEEGIRHDPPALPLERPDLMIYGKRTVKSPASTIVVAKVSGGEARTVYQDAAPIFVADATADGSRALLLRLVSPSEQILFELNLDLGNGSARRFWPPEGTKEAIGSAAYSPDGRTIYLATDQGGEQSALLAVDEASGKISARFSPDPKTATLDAIVPSPRGDVVVVHVDAGNRHAIRVLDARSLAEKVHPDIPAGQSELGDITLDGSMLSFTLATPDRPGDAYALDLGSGKSRRLRDDPRPNAGAIAPVETIVTAIPAFDGKPIPVHAYLPRSAAGTKLPVIVEFHGGPAASSTVGWKPRAQFFVAQGYAWVEPNVRGSTGFGRAWEMADNREKRGDVLEDMASVNAWVKAQPWADPDKVVIFGGSYGGWVVLEGLTHQQRLWSAGIDLVGVVDLRTLMKSTDQLIRAVFIDEFGDLDKDQALLAEWSPLKDADKIAAPLFVYQGANDPRVPRAESDSIVSALRRRNLPVEYMIAPNEGHSLDRRENQLEFYARSARFLEEHLGAPATAAAAR